VENFKNHVLKKFLEISFLMCIFQEIFPIRLGLKEQFQDFKIMETEISFLYGRQWEGYEIVQGIRQFGKSKISFSYPKSLYRLWGSPRLLFSWSQGSFPGDPGLGADADLSSPSGTEINHNWCQTFAPPIGLQSVDGDNIKFFHHSFDV
jgi:hypothetical protein